MENDTVALEVLRTSLDNLGQAGVEWVREADVADDTALEERERPYALCAVDDLVGEDKVHGLDLLPQRPDGREGDHAADADVPEGGNVGPVGHLVGRELVVQPMAGEERDVDAVVGEDVDGRRGLAPRRDGVENGDGLVALELGKAGASDDGDVHGL